MERSIAGSRDIAERMTYGIGSVSHKVGEEVSVSTVTRTENIVNIQGGNLSGRN